MKKIIIVMTINLQSHVIKYAVYKIQMKRKQNIINSQLILIKY